MYPKKHIIFLCFASFQKRFVMAHRDVSTSTGEKRIDDKTKAKTKQEWRSKKESELRTVCEVYSRKLKSNKIV